MNTKEPKTVRYFVDRRTGCIAVRDRDNTDHEYQGLHPDTRGVVWYRHGEYTMSKCPTCGHETGCQWEVKTVDYIMAHYVAENLNDGEDLQSIVEHFGGRVGI